MFQQIIAVIGEISSLSFKFFHQILAVYFRYILAGYASIHQVELLIFFLYMQDKPE
jgi:hypothetical protein